MITTDLMTGLEVIAVVTIATSLLVPLFCWVLFHPLATPSTLH
ncbi:MAG TPA: hypothetical protein V6D20_24605 [Candidatus Obscuribacterales bacterium]